MANKVLLPFDPQDIRRAVIQGSYEQRRQASQLLEDFLARPFIYDRYTNNRTNSDAAEATNCLGALKKIEGDYRGAVGCYIKVMDYTNIMPGASALKQRSLAYSGFAEIVRLKRLRDRYSGNSEVCKNPTEHQYIDLAIEIAEHGSYEYLRALDERGLVLQDEGRMEDAEIVFRYCLRVGDALIKSTHANTCTDNNDNSPSYLYVVHRVALANYHYAAFLERKYGETCLHESTPYKETAREHFLWLEQECCARTDK